MLLVSCAVDSPTPVGGGMGEGNFMCIYCTILLPHTHVVLCDTASVTAV